MANHGQYENKPSPIMVNNGSTSHSDKDCLNVKINHDQPWSSMVNHFQPWSTIVQHHCDQYFQYEN